MDNEHEDEPYIEEGMMVLCSTCHGDKLGAFPNFVRVCNHIPRRPIGEQSAGDPEIFDAEDSFSVSQNQSVNDNTDYVPTKIKRIVQDLLQTPDDEKR